MSADVPTRVLVVYGSETGNVRRAIGSCVDRWRAAPGHGKAFSIEAADVMAGNEAAAEFESLWELSARYNVIVVASSSFGEGDPPANFLRFLVKLVRAAARDGKKPLDGMQHAVLGFGQSLYPTFQNTPRYTDKLLEALGSRRMVKRVECDEGPTESYAPGQDPDGDDNFTAMGSGPSDGLTEGLRGRHSGVNEFAIKVLSALGKVPSTVKLAPVCPWTEPASTLIEKTEDELLNARPEIVPDSSGQRGSLAQQWLEYALVALAAGFATRYWMQQEQ